jgi:hypothetical protein
MFAFFAAGAVLAAFELLVEEFDDEPQAATSSAIASTAPATKVRFTVKLLSSFHGRTAPWEPAMGLSLAPMRSAMVNRLFDPGQDRTAAFSRT